MRLSCLYCGKELTKKQTRDFYHNNKRLDRPSNKRSRNPYCSIKCHKRFQEWFAASIYENLLIKAKHSLSVNKKKVLRIDFSDNIDAKYIEYLFKKQKNRCALTNIMLYSSGTIKRLEKFPHAHRPSIDRIDNSKGYEVGNIQIVSVMANWAKNKLSNEEAIEFFEMVRKN